MQNENFMIGAASAAFQDSQNKAVKSDWFKLIHDSDRESEYTDPMHATNLHLNPQRYIDALKSLGFNTFRFSIDWAYIEPVEGEFNNEALEWYDKFLEMLKEANVEPIVTLIHFTHPQWFIEKGGWEKRSNIKYALRFTSKIAHRYQRYIKYYATINEPSVYANFSYIQKQRPPFKRNLLLALFIQINLAIAHNRMYDKIHEIYKDEVMVGGSNAVWPLLDFKSKELTTMLKPFNYLINYIPFSLSKSKIDYIGLNYYGVFLIDFKSLINAIFKKNNYDEIKRAGLHKNSFGWWIYPEGLNKTIDYLARLNKPILITENGTYDDNPQKVIEYYKEHIKIIKEQTIKRKGSKSRIIGVTFWCLVDNFEWDYGYTPTFGLTKLNPNNPNNDFLMKDSTKEILKYFYELKAA